MLQSVPTQLAITCSKLAIETLEQGVKNVQKFFTPCSSVSIVNFEKVNASWVRVTIFVSGYQMRTQAPRNI